MEIDVSQLKIGDEFLYATNGKLARAIVIRPVKVKQKQPPYNLTNAVYYQSVKCKVAAIQKTYTNTWNGKTKTWTKNEYTTSDNYTIEKYLSLNYKNLWLIKRKDND